MKGREVVVIRTATADRVLEVESGRSRISSHRYGPQPQ